MAEEEQKSTSSGSPKRRRKRRPSRNRRRSTKSNSKATEQSATTPKSKAVEKQEPSRSSRRRRRRRPRSRKSSRSEQQSQAQAQSQSQVDALDAKLPESVFVYTHVVHSSALDTYGFRSDTFMNSSRSLDDFRIDLSAIFPEGSDADDANTPIFDSALHGPVSAHVSEDAESGDPVDDQERDNRGRAASATQPDGTGEQRAGDSHTSEKQEDPLSEDWLEDIQKAVDDRLDESSKEDSSRNE